MKNFLIEAVNLSKEIEGTTIYKNISFHANRTTIAIRGKNGSGKSTLLKTLAGIYEPTSGKVLRNTKKIGYVPEQFPENLRFKLKEYLLLTASFQGGNNLNSPLGEYIKLFGLGSFLNTPLRSCSKGTRQKVGLIQALLKEPDILFLDEPLTGLDSTSKHNLIHLLENLKNQITIIFIAHEEEIIKKLADQILNIETGEMSFYHSTSKKILKVVYPDQTIFENLELCAIDFEGNIALLTVETIHSDQILRELLNRNCSILEVKEKR